MGFLDRLFGSSGSGLQPAIPSAPPRRRSTTDDGRALERYRYLIRTAPPETLEQVHAEAFAKLSEEQRALIYEELSHGAATGERPLSSEPATLARAATRAELRVPGSLERVLGAPTAGQLSGFAPMLAGSLLGSVAGYVIGSALVSAFLPWDAAYDAADAAGGADAEEAGASGDPSAGEAGDLGGFDF